MAYVVMAIGALMLVSGLYAAVTGYQIVQVEAGWTSVIAGSVLIAGGVVTMALGLVIRVLLRLRPALVVEPQAPTVGTKATKTKTTMPGPASHDASSALGFALPPAAATGETPSLPLNEGKFRMPPPLPYSIAVRQAPFEASAEEEGTVASEAVTGRHDAVKTGFITEEIPFQPYQDDEPRPETPIDDIVHPADDYKLETPSTPEHDLPAEPSSPQAKPKDGTDVDWLDRALAALDEEIPIPVSAPRPTPSIPEREPRPAPIRRKPETSEPIAEDADGKVAKPALKTAPDSNTEPANTSAIIGRYEADGTSYIMYADGSIEAQSEAGVYRFASMAELKAHIEG